MAEGAKLDDQIRKALRGSDMDLSSDSRRPGRRKVPTGPRFNRRPEHPDYRVVGHTSQAVCRNNGLHTVCAFVRSDGRASVRHVRGRSSLRSWLARPLLPGGLAHERLVQPALGVTKTVEELCSLMLTALTRPRSGLSPVRSSSEVRNIRAADSTLQSSLATTTRQDYLKRVKRAVPQGGDLVITREAPMARLPASAGLKCCLGQRMVYSARTRTSDRSLPLVCAHSPALSSTRLHA